MAAPHEKLADSLDALRQAEVDGVITHDALSRTDRDRLLRAGFLSPIIKGWYSVARPEAHIGETSWFPFYWSFVRQYLESRFGEKYTLDARSSLLMHSGATAIPRQLVVLTGSGGYKVLGLPGGPSIALYAPKTGLTASSQKIHGINVLPLAEAITAAPEGFFRNESKEASILLRSISNTSPILHVLLSKGQSTVAGRLAGAFRANHQDSLANEILGAMKAAGYSVRESNPFERPLPELHLSRNPSPYEVRIRAMWAAMRQNIIPAFPTEPGIPANVDRYLSEVDEQYKGDAYNSLSIEGYHVTPELIDRVRGGKWDPEKDTTDLKSRDALAAKGYFDAFQEVRGSIRKILTGEPISILRNAHHEWYQSLFGPSVTAGIVRRSDLAGYRNHPVFIRGSNHVPLADTGVADAMATLFDLLETEPSAAVRAVLGHFIFVFIHPYGDGNGRLGRFLMNTMLASGGYPWTIVHVQRRAEYMAALEAASVTGDVAPFAAFLASELAIRDE